MGLAWKIMFLSHLQAKLWWKPPKTAENCEKPPNSAKIPRWWFWQYFHSISRPRIWYPEKKNYHSRPNRKKVSCTTYGLAAILDFSLKSPMRPLFFRGNIIILKLYGHMKVFSAKKSMFHMVVVKLRLAPGLNRVSDFGSKIPLTRIARACRVAKDSLLQLTLLYSGVT